jgi:hypothetical protein
LTVKNHSSVWVDIPDPKVELMVREAPLAKEAIEATCTKLIEAAIAKTAK